MKFLALSFIVVLGLATESSAQVYTWTDKKGIVHYSSKPEKNAKPAKLPPITREKTDSTVPKVVSCGKHSGVNCAAGPDSDGSVICFDGFREASLRFRFTCTAAKLEITQVTDAQEDGSFKVFLRNSRSVQAKGVKATLRLNDGTKVSLQGPADVEPFGVGEFDYRGPKVNFVPDAGHVDVTCSTCP